MFKLQKNDEDYLTLSIGPWYVFLFTRLLVPSRLERCSQTDDRRETNPCLKKKRFVKITYEFVTRQTSWRIKSFLQNDDEYAIGHGYIIERRLFRYICWIDSHWVSSRTVVRKEYDVSIVISGVVVESRNVIRFSNEWWQKFIWCHQGLWRPSRSPFSISEVAKLSNEFVDKNFWISKFPNYWITETNLSSRNIPDVLVVCQSREC